MPNRIKPEVSKCCKAEIRYANNGETITPFCDNCLMDHIPKKRVKKAKLGDKVPSVTRSEEYMEKTFSAACIEKDCPWGELPEHEHILFTGGFDKWKKQFFTDLKTPSWHTAIRILLLITLGILLPIAYVKLNYTVHVGDLGDLILLKR